MSLKRSRSGDDPAPQITKRPRKGFSVAPANLPDGTYRRKAQKIKASLIQKAKTKKAYAKLRERELANYEPRTRNIEEGEDDVEQSSDKETSTRNGKGEEDEEKGDVEMHPQRAAMISYSSSARSNANASADIDPDTEPQSLYQSRHPDRDREPRHRDTHKRTTKPKPSPYRQAELLATQRREADERRRKQTEERLKERTAMARAMRPDRRDGKVKLGRQSKVLLGRVERLMRKDGK